MKFFRIFHRRSFYKPQHDWDILRRPQDANVLGTFTAVWPMPQYILLIRKQLSPGRLNLVQVTVAQRTAIQANQTEVSDCGGRGSVSQSSHVVPAGSCLCTNACDEEIILRNEAIATGDYQHSV
jgi:hypothetical protein